MKKSKSRDSVEDSEAQESPAKDIRCFFNGGLKAQSFSKRSPKRARIMSPDSPCSEEKPPKYEPTKEPTKYEPTYEPPKQEPTYEPPKQEPTHEPPKQEPTYEPPKQPTKQPSEDKPRIENKALNYREYLARKTSGPPNLGSKPIPKGSDTCLLGLTFVFTGVLSSISRDDAITLIKTNGGRVTSAPSSKTSYIVIGEDPSEQKLKKAKSLKTKTLNEDEMLELIKVRAEDELLSKMDMKSILSQAEKSSDTKSSKRAMESPTGRAGESAMESAKSAGETPNVPFETMWVNRYAPETLEDLIGNASLASKLLLWLKKWDTFAERDFKDTNIEGGTNRAALLSGPPGIGKTTAAHLVAKCAGYTPLEFNASDTRNKKALTELVLETTRSKTISSYFSPKFSKHLLIMDEIDGVSSGDSGGIPELIKIIKETKVPILCICNDRQSQKIRSVAGYCFDLRFRRPTSIQAEKKITAIAKKENLKIGVNVVPELIASCSGDIRQILTSLSTYKLLQNEINFSEAKKLCSESKKDISMNTFDVTYKLFANKNLNIDEKLELFFQDFSLIPLMVHENYIKFLPRTANFIRKDSVALNALASAAESISNADIIETSIGRLQDWSLLPAFGVLSCITPTFCAKGFARSPITFSSWLGNNSKRTKTQKILSEITPALKLKMSTNKTSFLLECLKNVQLALYMPLIKQNLDGVECVIETMDYYSLGLEERELLLDMQISEMPQVPSNVKRALTREYKKTHVQYPRKESQNFDIKDTNEETLNPIFL